jgi:hypothetical protein
MQVNVVSYQIKELFEKSQNVLVVLGNNVDNDLACLAASLVEVFSSYKKQATLISTTELPLAARPLVKPEAIRSKLDPESLIISFDWTKNQLEKVSYSVEGNRFDLIISSNGKRLNPSDISYSYRGQKFNLIVTVGVKNLEELRSHGIEVELFNSVPSLNFDKNRENTQFAKINLISPSTDGVAYLATNVFKAAKIVLPTKAAEILLVGVREATKNFTNVADPSTFEAAAYLKRCMIPGMVNFTIEKEQKAKEEEQETPENWLSPKIFRSSRVS